ncbi:glycosyltransferase [Motiliproteus sp. SC1-56]|uniref:glycosyltransferase n=1 Tax=Motiliproteus sp. SC1-56 TaxID=2799565 RepID=UPI001A8E91F6
MTSSDSAKTVLVLAGEYPPLKTIGRIRSAKFVEHLRDLGWQPVVVTLDFNRNDPTYFADLESEIPDDVQVIRVANQRLDDWVLCAAKRGLGLFNRNSDRLNSKAVQAPSKNEFERRPGAARTDRLTIRFKHFVRNWVHVPDDYILWGFRAYYEALKICKTQRVDLIYTSLPPFSSAIAGYLLKRKTKLPWVVDYRDLWIGDVLREWLPPIRERFEGRLEKQIIGSADAVIAVSEQKTEFLRQHIGGERIWETITNGYDPESFDYLLGERHSDKATIDFVYAGRLFKNRRGYAFVHALGELAAEDESVTRRVRVHFYGEIEPGIFSEYQRLIALYGLEPVFVFHGDVDYESSKRAQIAADYLLLIVDTGATTDGVIPGKVFEYVASKRPILALCDSRATREIIQRANIGQVVGAEDRTGCKDALKRIIDRTDHELIDVDSSYLSQFERRNLSRRLGALFDRLT